MTFGPHTITVVNRGTDGTRDRLNNLIVVELGTFDIEGCFVQQRDSDEELADARETVITRWNVITPDPSPNTINAIDHVRINAATVGVTPDAGETFATFQFDGAPDHAFHINGVLHHIEALIRRVDL